MKNLSVLNTIPVERKYVPYRTAPNARNRTVLQSQVAVSEIMSSPHWGTETQSTGNGEIVQQRLVVLLIWVVVMMGLSIAVVSQLYDGAPILQIASPASNDVAEVQPEPAAVVPAAPAISGEISPVFSKEVQAWGPQIGEWSRMYGLDANQIATIMQIESCGDPYAESWVGAQGLFQVMPFHFTEGENMKDPATNARRGINYFRERMVQTNGDVGLSFAGYNGGHGAAGSHYSTWAHETQQYFYWATGIYEEAMAGKQHSERLAEWMEAGGISLCVSATENLGLQ